jgi:hypothetical protein
MIIVLAAIASLDLLRRAADPNPTLQSYTASARLSATLKAVVPVHQTFNGTAYYLKPKRKIEFQGVPGPLSRFKDLATTTPSYEEASAEYAITPLDDTAGMSTYSLAPKKADSRVKSLTVTVNDSSALVMQVRWLYTNGGQLEFTQTYTKVQQFSLPSEVNITARFPGYSVDGTLSFSNYRPNASVSPSLFASP